ncbi:MAG: metallophosphoesterase [Pseudomonadales bacterium]|nr:metallophosphoesterase [Pseudomonadales bacterium]
MTQNFLTVDKDFRLAIVGDLHTHWDHIDLAQFARANYDLLYFTGDLGGGTPDSTLRIAQSIAQLNQPALVMPGNNDTGDIHQLAAELTHQNGMNRLLSITKGTENTQNPISLCGYSQHRINTPHTDIGLIAARPHSMGGVSLSFPEYMEATYGISTLEQSTQRLIDLVDNTDTENLIFLAHNGPQGLGQEPQDMWGCDFKENGGDWGDPDLTDAIFYAREKGKKILAVIGGHMHLRTKQGHERPWKTTIGDTLYINAAKVPRIFQSKEDVHRHHILMTINEQGIQIEEKLIPEYG